MRFSGGGGLSRVEGPHDFYRKRPKRIWLAPDKASPPLLGAATGSAMKLPQQVRSQVQLGNEGMQSPRCF
jgi:hypothetical protein